uniref:Uncharacterized protein n=1 Tax=Arundo donax TaxID=35708 RepID=A0A0A9GAR6_ARUDO
MLQKEGAQLQYVLPNAAGVGQSCSKSGKERPEGSKYSNISSSRLTSCDRSIFSW